MDRFIIGFGPSANEYIINGVRYIVEGHYEPVDFRNMDENVRLDHRIENYITSDFADLPTLQATDTIEPEYVRSVAGKEENNATEKEE
ncbi:MAG: hypothetical protein J1F24_04065 [Oscillospiraceae bacterium]|nr:hypothetical protein [Oscillospiraceae bacterium]